jgi:AraC-like DNA-binding protein
MPSIDYIMPAEHLRDYVSVYYVVEFTHGFEDIERAALAQLRFSLDGGGTVHFARGRTFELRGVSVIGPTSTAIRYVCDGPYRMFGMGLLPAGWGLLTETPANSVRDSIVPANAIIPGVDDYMGQLQSMSHVSEMAVLADSVLEPLIAEARPDILDFTRQVDHWLAANTSPEIADLQSITGLSTRQLARKVNHFYGMPPKYLSRKYRALRAARILAENVQEDHDYLYDAFYDQSHMIRELKLFTGTTPAKLGSDFSLLAPLIDKRSKFVDKISPLTAKT